MAMREKQLAAFGRLLDIMDDLRAKCPWDKKQTMESLRHLTIEETYELGDAILNNDLQEVKKELGDLLLHIVFYAKIGSETGDFDIADVANGVCEKLIVRHPHIYGDVKVANEEDARAHAEDFGRQPRQILLHRQFCIGDVHAVDTRDDRDEKDGEHHVQIAFSLELCKLCIRHATYL